MTDNLNIELYNFKEPTFDSNKKIFVSKFVDHNNNIFEGVVKNMIILNIIEYSDNFVIQTEFSSNNNKFYDFFLNMDEKAKKEIINNGDVWLGSEMDFDVVDNLFKNTIKVPVKIPALPYMNFIINKTILNNDYDNNYNNNGNDGNDDNEIQCKITKKRKNIKIADLKSKNEINIRFKIDGINFYKNKCNLNYIATEIILIREIGQTFECLIED